MTHFEEIKQMDIDGLAKMIQDARDDICFEVCTKSAGNKFRCPYGEDVEPQQCEACVKNGLRVKRRIRYKSI